MTAASPFGVLGPLTGPQGGGVRTPPLHKTAAKMKKKGLPLGSKRDHAHARVYSQELPVIFTWWPYKIYGNGMTTRVGGLRYSFELTFFLRENQVGCFDFRHS